MPERAVVALVCVPEFGRDENFVAGYSAFGKCFADAFFVGVKLRRVDMAVARKQSLLHAVYAGVAVGRKISAETHAGDFDTVSEFECVFRGREHFCAPIITLSL